MAKENEKMTAVYNNTLKVIVIGGNAISPGKYDLVTADTLDTWRKVYPRVKELLDSGDLILLDELVAQARARHTQELAEAPAEEYIYSDKPEKGLHVIAGLYDRCRKRGKVLHGSTYGGK